jgi:acetylornithine deacetylase/succinyl-diaminopimelate desuccinylase-like protein
MRRALRLPLLALLFCSLAVCASPRSRELSESAKWLRDYLRIDTTNPPGHEEKAAAFLAAILEREGIATRRLVSPKGRTSLLARLSSPGSGGRAVILLHHMDVVPAGPGWTAPPFSGELRDGRLWGRGAIDIKSLGLAQLAAIVDLKRRNVALERDVIFLAVADEEDGGGQGVGWLIDAHPELFRGVEAVMGEGGRSQVSGGRLLWWGVETAQKRPLWLSVATTGRGGHASGLNPQSAVHRLIQGLDRVLAMPPRWRVTAPARDYLKAIAPLHNDHWRRILGNVDRVIDPEKGPREFLLPGMSNLFLDTVQVTVLQGSDRINVIPDRAQAEIDVRLLPDTDSAAFLAAIEKTLGEGFDVEILRTAPPAPPTPATGRFYDAVVGVLGKEAPVVPTFVPGFTDSRYFRERGIAAYGISPFALSGEETAGIHARDEQIPVAELDRGAARVRRLVAAYAAAR